MRYAPGFVPLPRPPGERPPLRSGCGGVAGGAKLGGGAIEYPMPVGRQESEDNFFTSRAGIEDGVVASGQLVLMESGTTLLLRNSTAAEPVRCTWTDQGARRRLEACGGEIYALYEIDRQENLFEDQEDGFVHAAWGGFARIGLGHPHLAEDGTFTVEEPASFDGSALFDPRGEAAANCTLSRIDAGNGKLSFTTVCDAANGTRIERLFDCDLTGYALTESAVGQWANSTPAAITC